MPSETCLSCGERMAVDDVGVFHRICRARRMADTLRHAAEEDMFDALKHAKELPDGKQPME